MNKRALDGLAQAPLLFALPGAQHLAQGLQALGCVEVGELDLHRFPDGECCPRYLIPVAGRDVVLAACMDDPDAKLFALQLCAAVASELGARSVGFVLPYLPYMRQDTVFLPGQGTSARHVGRLLSACADWLVTIDPHLHRFATLDRAYGIPAQAASSAAALAAWIRANVPHPWMVGPDSESAQWVEQVAAMVGCAGTVLEKTRHGDRSVSVRLTAPPPAGLGTPVLLDDIASSGHTMAAAIDCLRQAGAAAPVCLVVHPLFAGDALDVIARAGPARIVSCNTLAHPSNAVDICPVLAEAIAAVRGQPLAMASQVRS